MLLRSLVAIHFLIPFAVNAASLSEGRLAVVANESGAPEALTIRELKAVFKGEKQRWSDRTKITLALTKPSISSGEQIIRKLYGMDRDAWNKYWLIQVFRGRTNPPKYFETEELLQSFVSRTPGSIGIVRSQVAGGAMRRVLVEGQQTW